MVEGTSSRSTAGFDPGVIALCTHLPRAPALLLGTAHARPGQLPGRRVAHTPQLSHVLPVVLVTRSHRHLLSDLDTGQAELTWHHRSPSRCGRLSAQTC